MKIKVEPNLARKTNDHYPIMLKLEMGRGNVFVPISVMEAQSMQDELRELLGVIHSSEEDASWET